MDTKDVELLLEDLEVELNIIQERILDAKYDLDNAWKDLIHNDELRELKCLFNIKPVLKGVFGTYK